MKNIRISFFPYFVIALFSLSVTSNCLAKEPDRDMRVNVTMKKIGDTMIELFPIILNENKFNDEKNTNKIALGINDIVALIKIAEPHFKKRSKANQISYSVLEEHLSNSRQAFQSGNKRYAQDILKDTVSVCTSCHIQDAKQKLLFKGNNRKAFSNDYEFAEFSFLTRNYPAALQYYNRYLMSPASLKPENMILNSARKTLTIYTQIKNQPGEASAQFEKYIKDGNLTPFVEASVVEWNKGLKELEKNKAFKVKEVTFGELEHYVHKYLGPLDNPGAAVVPTKKERVYHIWLQGLLYKYLFNDPDPEDMPKLLYWLSINDRATNYSFHYSLADLYLKECMLTYTSHYYAKKCFDEYNEYIIFSYSGSLGTDIPDDIQQEIKSLRDTVYGKKPN